MEDSPKAKRSKASALAEDGVLIIRVHKGLQSPSDRSAAGNRRSFEVAAIRHGQVSAWTTDGSFSSGHFKRQTLENSVLEKQRVCARHENAQGCLHPKGRRVAGLGQLPEDIQELLSDT